MTRREFVRGTIAVAAAAAAPASLVATAKAAGAASDGRLRRSTFAPLVGRAFTMTARAGQTPVTLESVVDPRSGLDEHRFSLIFRAPDASSAPAGIYRFRARGGDPVDLCVNPIDRGVAGRRLEAVVNS